MINPGYTPLADCRQMKALIYPPTNRLSIPKGKALQQYTNRRRFAPLYTVALQPSTERWSNIHLPEQILTVHFSFSRNSTFFIYRRWTLTCYLDLQTTRLISHRVRTVHRDAKTLLAIIRDGFLVSYREKWTDGSLNMSRWIGWSLQSIRLGSVSLRATDLLAPSFNRGLYYFPSACLSQAGIAVYQNGWT